MWLMIVLICSFFASQKTKNQHLLREVHLCQEVLRKSLPDDFLGCLLLKIMTANSIESPCLDKEPYVDVVGVCQEGRVVYKRNLTCSTKMVLCHDFLDLDLVLI